MRQFYISTQYSFPILRDDPSPSCAPKEMQQWPCRPAAAVPPEDDGALVSGASDSLALPCSQWVTHRASSESSRNLHSTEQETCHPLWHPWPAGRQCCYKAHQTRRTQGQGLKFNPEFQALVPCTGRSRGAFVSRTVRLESSFPTWSVQSNL